MGTIFKAHDAPLIFLLLAAGTLTLAFVTALFGRIWCGWACPQTVFIDSIYRRLENLILGSYIEKRRLQKEPMSFLKFRKMGLLWISFFIVSAVIAHSFVAYFVGSDRLLEMMQGSPEENWAAFVTIFGMTLALLFDFGWFREQFCIIACPYGRIQSVLMDKQSLSILYNTARGEPRKSPDVPKDKQGDCVNCRRCVEVCPTGIDIRRGIQLECIGCTACIDACDEIMVKTNRPQGLISYNSEYELEKGIKLSWKQRLTRPRVLIYFTVISLSLLMFSFFLSSREDLMMSVLKTKDQPYTSIVEGTDPKILNHFKLHLHNQSLKEMKISAQAPQGTELILPERLVVLAPNSSRELHFFIKFAPSETIQNGGTAKKTLQVFVEMPDRSFIAEKPLTLIGPMN